MFWQILFNVDICDVGHSIEKIERIFIWSSTNTFLNNFCSRENDDITCCKLSKKKKKKEIFKDSAKFSICNIF